MHIKQVINVFSRNFWVSETQTLHCRRISLSAPPTPASQPLWTLTVVSVGEGEMMECKRITQMTLRPAIEKRSALSWTGVRDVSVLSIGDYVAVVLSSPTAFPLVILLYNHILSSVAALSSLPLLQFSLLTKTVFFPSRPHHRHKQEVLWQAILCHTRRRTTPASKRLRRRMVHVTTNQPRLSLSRSLPALGPLPSLLPLLLLLALLSFSSLTNRSQHEY